MVYMSKALLHSTVASSSIDGTSSITSEFPKDHKRELVAANAGGDDRNLATYGSNPHYWYSISDGHRLVLDIRGRLLSPNYIPADLEVGVVVRAGEEYASTRENSLRIFVSDPYYYSTSCIGSEIFSNYLNSDIDRIIKQGAYVGIETRAWWRLPEKLIIPVLSGAHWRVVIAEIDYGELVAITTDTEAAPSADSSVGGVEATLRLECARNPTLRITINDPYGSSNVTAIMREDVTESLVKVTNKLLIAKYGSGEAIGGVTPDNIHLILKEVDQQGRGGNGWDCGPITFRNLEDYALQAKEERNLSEFTDFTIPPVGTESHDTRIAVTRQEHIQEYARVTGIPINIGREEEIIGFIKKDAKAKIDFYKTDISGSDNDIYRQISSLLPEQITQLFTILENKRLFEDSTHTEEQYTKDEFMYAIGVIKEVMHNKVAATERIGRPSIKFQDRHEEFVGNDFMGLIKIPPLDSSFEKTFAEFQSLFNRLYFEMGTVSPGENAFLVLGNTKSGKSTLVNYLIGNTLIPLRHKHKLLIQHEGDGPEIGLSFSSCTELPTRWNSPVLGGTIWDFPGWRDTRGSMREVIAISGIKEILHKFGSVRFILVSDSSDLHYDRADNFLSLLHFADNLSLPDIAGWLNGLSVIFTKPKNLGYFEITTSTVIELLHEMILSESVLIGHNKTIIEFFLQHPERIGLFGCKEDDSGSVLEIIDENVQGAISHSVPIPTEYFRSWHPLLSSQARVFAIKCLVKLSHIPEFDTFLSKLERYYQSLLDRILNDLDDKKIDEKYVSHVLDQIPPVIMQQTKGDEDLYSRVVAFSSDRNKQGLKTLVENVLAPLSILELIQEISNMDLHDKVGLARLDCVILNLKHKIEMLQFKIQHGSIDAPEEMGPLTELKELQQTASEHALKILNDLEQKRSAEMTNLFLIVSAFERGMSVDLDNRSDNSFALHNRSVSTEEVPKSEAIGESKDNIEEQEELQLPILAPGSSSKCIISYIPKIEYSNVLLEYYEVFVLFERIFGNSAASELLSLTNLLCQDFRNEIEEVCSTPQAIPIFASLIGLDVSCYEEIYY